MSFVPKGDVEEYLHNTFNSTIFIELNRSPIWRDTFNKPLDFFNILYEQFSELKAQINKPLTVINGLMALELNSKQLYYLLEKLQLLLKQLLKDVRTSYDFEVYSNLDTYSDSIRNIDWHISLKKNSLPDYSNSNKQNEQAIPEAQLAATQKKPADDKAEETSKTLFALGERQKKADLVRILNVMYEIGFINESETNKSPAKELFMKRAGDFFGTDLSRYAKILNSALDQSVEANGEIFKRMADKSEKIVRGRLESKNSNNASSS